MNDSLPQLEAQKSDLHWAIGPCPKAHLQKLVTLIRNSSSTAIRNAKTLMLIRGDCRGVFFRR